MDQPTPIQPIATSMDRAILFRTALREVYEVAVKDGSVWLRSDQFYRSIEDATRRDHLESSNGAKSFIRVSLPDSCILGGDGDLATSMAPHYIMSLHGTAIDEDVRLSFGGYTYGIRDWSELARELAREAAAQIPVISYHWGQVSYQYGGLRVTNLAGGGLIRYGHSPSRTLAGTEPSYFRKRPVEPFIRQDEWRIVLQTDGYLDSDPQAPLKLNVDPAHFFRYLEG